LAQFPLLDRITLRIRKPDAPVESDCVELEVTLNRS
jgi:dihydroneopterin aldolase